MLEENDFPSPIMSVATTTYVSHLHQTSQARMIGMSSIIELFSLDPGYLEPAGSMPGTTTP